MIVISHVSHVDLHIKDLDALKQACKALGLDFHENQKTYKWYGRWVNDYSAADAAYHHGIKPEDYGKCEHAISAPGAGYELGVIKNPTGPGYTLIYDNFCQGYGLEAAIGKGASKVRQAYAVQVATKQARKQGFRVQQSVGQDGKVRLVCTR